MRDAECQIWDMEYGMKQISYPFRQQMNSPTIVIPAEAGIMSLPFKSKSYSVS